MESNTLIRVTCPDCGDVCVSAADLTVRVCIDTQRWSYCFRCQSCDRATAWPTIRTALEHVLALGVEILAWHLPAELAEPRPVGTTLTLDDLLDFHLLLEGDEWYGRAAAGSGL